MIEAWAKFSLLKSPDRGGDGSGKDNAPKRRRKGSPPEGETKEQKRERLRAKRLRNAEIRARDTAERLAREQEARQTTGTGEPKQKSLGPAASAARALDEFNRAQANVPRRNDEPPTSAGVREPSGPRRGGPHNNPRSPRKAENPLPTDNDKN